MADEEVPQTDVNSQVAPEASSTPVAQAEAVTPPADEKSVADKSEGKIPYSRFSEVIDQRNKEKEMRVQYENRIKELESKSSPQKRDDVSEAEVKRLVTKLGMSEEAAKEVIAATQNVARAERGSVEAKLHQYEVESWTRNMAEKYPDFRDLQPAMEKEFSSLEQGERQYIISSPGRLERFYKSVKADLADFVAKESFAKGTQAAYDTKLKKQAISSVPGTAAQPQNGELTAEKIRNMSISEYKTRQSEINDWVTKQGRSR